MEKEIYTILYISFGSGCFILLIFSLMAFINVKGMHIQEGNNIRGGMILLVNTILYGIIAFCISKRIQRLKYEEAKNKNLDNFLELPAFFSKTN